jgi:hypothetical protein
MIKKSKERELVERQQEAQYNIANTVADLLEEEGECERSMPMRMKKSAHHVQRASAPRSRAALPAASFMSRSTASMKESAPPPAPVASSSKNLSNSTAVQNTTTTTTTTTTTSADAFDAAYDDSSVTRDYTKIPALLDSKFESLGKGNVIRPTIIHPGTQWQRKSQKSLMSKPSDSVLGTDEHKLEKNKAFDLLDALTKSGALTVDHASLHVVMVATHCFDKTLLETVIQDNVNPIEKVEQTTLIISETIHGQHIEDLVKADHLLRISNHSPQFVIRNEN